jgi:SsrA-binding protein
LIYKLKTKNYLLVPLLLFFNQKGWAKLEIGLVLPLRKYQIKAKIKEKEIKKKLQKRDFDGI